MPKLWQRMAANPANLETLWLLDCAYHLKNVAWRDYALREQLRPALEWALRGKLLQGRSPATLPGLKEAP